MYVAPLEWTAKLKPVKNAHNHAWTIERTDKGELASSKVCYLCSEW